MFTIFERSLFATNYLFNSQPAILFFENTKIMFSVLIKSDPGTEGLLFLHSISMMLYATPVFVLLFFIFKKNIKSMQKDYSLIRNQRDQYPAIKKHVDRKVKRICKYAGTRMPIVRITDSLDIKAETRFLGMPFFRNVVIVSVGTWNELRDKDQELEILLAHEIWHIKKHTLARRVLCLLSDYSLFGNGFLALLQNSFKIEKEADTFAVKWVSRKNDKKMAVQYLKSLLERIEEVTWINGVSRPGESLSFSMFRNDTSRSEFFKLFNALSWFGKAKINLGLLFQIYFGNEIQSYLHPSLNQRVNWAREGL